MLLMKPQANYARNLRLASSPGPSIPFPGAPRSCQRIAFEKLNFHFNTAACQCSTRAKDVCISFSLFAHKTCASAEVGGMLEAGASL